MKNLKSRDEYLQTANEGFIKDTIKKGWEKVKSFFKVGLKKIKDMIVLFDNSGNILPVVTPQAVIDMFSDSEAVHVYAPQAMVKSVVDAGGKGCETTAPLGNNDVDYDEGPDGKEYANWMHDKKYEDSNEYKNMETLCKMLKENAEYFTDGAVELLEAEGEWNWEAIKKERTPYIDKSQFGPVKKITGERFKKIIQSLIEDRIIRGGKRVVRASDNKTVDPYRNILVFGAPGIGKSTMPNQVIEEYNARAEGKPSEMMSIINVDCGNLHPGDVMMPTMPKELPDIMDDIRKSSDVYTDAAAELGKMSQEEYNEIADKIGRSGQFKSYDAPKSWLPAYKPVGGKANIFLDSKANGGVYIDGDGNAYETGNGGIIIFDEFLRADPDVFGELMNFFLFRKVGEYVLGSKWVIIACSNRPCDDDQVARVWKSWNGAPAKKGRQERMYQLLPEPDMWRKWISKKGADKIILDFIFDEDSMAGDEYPRWHSHVKNGVGESGQVIPIDPRQWERAINEINRYELENDLVDITEMEMDDIKFCMEGFFDEGFIEEFIEWLEKHLDKVDLDGIMENPQSIGFPNKFKHDPEGANILIKTMLEEMKKRYEKDPGKISDEQLANIIMWLGINFKEQMQTVNDFIIKISDDIFKRDDDQHRFAKYVKANMMLIAAFPESELDEIVDYFENIPEEKGQWPSGSMDILKDLMKKYFPWRIDGDDNVKFVDKLDIKDTAEKADVNKIDDE